MKHLVPLLLVVTITLLAACGVFVMSNSGNDKTGFNGAITPGFMGCGMYRCI